MHDSPEIARPHKQPVLIRGYELEVASVAEGRIWLVDLSPLLEGVYANDPSAGPTVDWSRAMLSVAKNQPEVSFRGGTLKTSRADPSFETRYQPTVGLTIARELPWLIRLYQGAFRDLVACLKNDPSIRPGINLKRYINMNLTRGLRHGAHQPRGYELHRDDCMVSIVLAACDSRDDDKGATRFFDAQGSQLAIIQPKRGFAIVFDGPLDHDVEPWEGVDDRLVLTCNYFSADYTEPPIPEETAETALFGPQAQPCI